MMGRDKAHITIADALGALASHEGGHSTALFAHGSLLVKVYAPVETDPQTPHTRDEIYVVMRGRGIFFDGEIRRPVGPGDFLFVAAGRIHRFEDFTADFATWVMYFGPEGGDPELPREESPAPRSM
jgi:mannose-6-phosphate isomerase-like protein (cupin superfamily)